MYYLYKKQKYCFSAKTDGYTPNRVIPRTQIRTISNENPNHIYSQTTQDNPGFIDDTNFTEVDLNDSGRNSAAQSPMARYIANVAAR